jgi:hypothetical protein
LNKKKGKESGIQSADNRAMQKLVLEIEILNYSETMKIDQRECDQELQVIYKTLKELDDVVLTISADSLHRRYYGNEESFNIDYAYLSDSILEVIITTSCNVNELYPGDFYNLQEAERTFKIVILIRQIMKSMVTSIEPLPKSPEATAAMLYKQIESTLQIFGPSLQYSFAEYQKMEKRRAPKNLKGLIDFRANFLNYLKEKIQTA